MTGNLLAGPHWAGLFAATIACGFVWFLRHPKVFLLRHAPMGGHVANHVQGEDYGFTRNSSELI